MEKKRCDLTLIRYVILKICSLLQPTVLTILVNKPYGRMNNLLQLLANIINVSIIRWHVSSILLSDLCIMNMAWNPALLHNSLFKKNLFCKIILACHYVSSFTS
jgi:hypothetical protein